MAKLSKIDEKKAILITGGAGFIGTNLAHKLALQGNRVLIFDNLSRPGVNKNLEWLKQTHGSKISIKVADIRDPKAINQAVCSASHVFHFAAQVAVTTSLTSPVDDFQTNTVGTLNILEAIRSCTTPPPMVFTSTNKVYGKLKGISFIESETRYFPDDRNLLYNGIKEDQHLDFYSPYGCSKGSADQYVLDYSRIYGLHTTVFRMSCIYGPHQFGTEDQGWVAHFLISMLNHQKIIIYGNGKQVRDILYIDDLVDAFLLAKDNISKLKGRAFNIGGGPKNSISLMELLLKLKLLTGIDPELSFDAPRPGDQEYYVSGTSSFTRAVGWTPQHSVDDGLLGLHNWLQENRLNFRDERRWAAI